ncbi:MAG: GIY-YIG nuclease family protein [Alphaproteobacteria bacterium]|nr:GIY-YIG nuclease family protein [Alphaproteobacteria bacterium]
MEGRSTRMYLYRITNQINTKTYIGITVNPRSRFQQHCLSSSSCIAMKSAIKKYGKENFRYDVLISGEEKYIKELEQKAIIKFSSHVDNHGYNISHGGSSNHRIDWSKVDKLLGVDSDREIARLVGVDSTSISRRRRELEIPKNIENTNRRRKLATQTHQWKTPLGIFNSLRDAAFHCGVHHSTISSRCNKGCHGWERLMK